MHLDPAGFVVFRSEAGSAAHPVALVLPAGSEPVPSLVINYATYGAKGGDPSDVTSTVAAAVQNNDLSLRVKSRTFDVDADPDPSRELVVDYTLNGQAKAKQRRTVACWKYPPEASCFRPVS